MEYFSAIINLLANLAKLARLMLVLLSLGFAWKDALVNVTPKTFTVGIFAWFTDNWECRSAT